jgi:hypothetical protein
MKAVCASGPSFASKSLKTRVRIPDVALLDRTLEQEPVPAHRLSRSSRSFRRTTPFRSWPCVSDYERMGIQTIVVLDPDGPPLALRQRRLRAARIPRLRHSRQPLPLRPRRDRKARRLERIHDRCTQSHISKVLIFLRNQHPVPCFSGHCYPGFSLEALTPESVIPYGRATGRKRPSLPRAPRAQQRLPHSQPLGRRHSAFARGSTRTYQTARRWDLWLDRAAKRINAG